MLIKKDYLTLADVCMELSVSSRTVYRMVADGTLPAPRRLGTYRRVYFVRSEFEKACRRAIR